MLRGFNSNSMNRFKFMIWSAVILIVIADLTLCINNFCSDDLGLSSFDSIPNSSFSSPGHPDSNPYLGRLNNNDGAWQVDLNVSSVENSSLIVDLGRTVFVSAILWQGPPAVSDYSYRILIRHTFKDSPSKGDWIEENFRLIINSHKDASYITVIKPDQWKVKRLRYIQIQITHVVRKSGPVGGRLGLFGCEEFIPKVQGSLNTFVDGSAKIGWTDPVVFISVLNENITTKIDMEYYQLSYRHKSTGPPDFIDSMENNYFQVPSMILGVNYTFELKCYHDQIPLSCGSWYGVAYPDCPENWTKNGKYCYKESDSPQISIKQALEQYNNTFTGLKATFADEEEERSFFSRTFQNFEGTIIDKECYLTECCIQYTKNENGSCIFNKTCGLVDDMTSDFIYVRYVPVTVSNCSNVEISVMENNNTLVTFERQTLGWPTPMKALVQANSTSIIHEQEISKLDTNVTISGLGYYQNYNFRCVPYMSDDWRFDSESEDFINVESVDGKKGAFKPDVEVSYCNQWNGEIKISWPVSFAKSTDAEGSVLKIPADSYEIFYTIKQKNETISKTLKKTDNFLFIDSLMLSSSISCSISCTFSSNHVQCGELEFTIDPPSVLKANSTHFIAYELKTKPMNWLNSELDCQACGGHLASIGNKESEKPLQKFSDSTNQFHVGIQTCREGVWTDGTFIIGLRGSETNLITSVVGENGRWTDGTLFSYIPENGELYLNDKCCGSAKTTKDSLSLNWVACAQKHQRLCMTVVAKPTLIINCEALSVSKIQCFWKQDGAFWQPSGYDFKCDEISDGSSKQLVANGLKSSNHTFDDLLELTKYQCTISTNPKGYLETFEATQTLYSGYENAIDWTVDSKGNLNITWNEFTAFGDQNTINNVTCKNLVSGKEIPFSGGSKELALGGFLYNNNYSCLLIGKHANGSAIHSSFIFHAKPSCEKGQVAVDDVCVTTFIGDSTQTNSNLVDNKQGNSDIKEVIKDKDGIKNMINDSVIWLNSSANGCCRTFLDDLDNVSCSTDPKECSRNHTVIIAKDNSPPFCKLKSVEVQEGIDEATLLMERSDCWGDHYIKISYQKVTGDGRRKRSITEAITQDSNYTIGNLDPDSTYTVSVEPSTADGTTSNDPSVVTDIAFDTLPELTTTEAPTTEAPTTTTLSTKAPSTQPTTSRIQDVVTTVQQTISTVHETTIPSVMTAALFQGIKDEPLIALRIAACSIVILCVGLTLILYIYSKMFHLDSLCMMCSSVCIIGAYVSILLGTVEVHHITYVSKEMCQTMALFLHFFYLAAFTFLLLELVCISMLLANVPPRKFASYSWVIFSIGWVVPLLIITITGGVLHSHYITNSNCWIHIDGEAFVPFIVPIAIILVACLFFILVIIQSHELDKDDMKLSEYQRAKECLSTRWATMFMLLITTMAWILGFLAENNDSRDLYIGFIILSFMLGFSHIIIRCLAETEVRETIANLFCCLPKNNSYRFGSITPKPKSEDPTGSEANLTKFNSKFNSSTSVRSDESYASADTVSTSARSDVTFSRPGSTSSVIAPLRKASFASTKPMGKLRPGTAAIRR